MKKLNEWTRREFERLPARKEWNKSERFDSLVILPCAGSLHDSGYRRMDFVGVRAGKPICRLSGCSDVLHVDGIGGYGPRRPSDYRVPEALPPRGWSIDCLARSGLLHMFVHEHEIETGWALSSFETFAIPRAKP